MGQAAEQLLMSSDEFLAWDAAQALRHEFVAGEIFAMAGGEDKHNTVAQNVMMALRAHLDGTGCRVYTSDVKLRVEAANCYFYPDVMVTCSTTDHADALVKSQAKLVVEVLSPATAAFDRGDKFAAYRLLPTLQEYLLIDTDKRRCDLYRRGADALSVLHPGEVGDAAQLNSVALGITAQRLFAQL